MIGSDVGHGSLSGGSDDKHQRAWTDKAFPHSLASMPAGLEVVPANDKHFQQAEKETVQAAPEAISQDGKEVASISAPPYETLMPLEDRRAERRTCGLKSRLFWALIATLVVALALVVGLAGGLGVRRSRRSPSCDSCMTPHWAFTGASNTLYSHLEYIKFGCQLTAKRRLWRGQRRRRCRKAVHYSDDTTTSTRES